MHFFKYMPLIRLFDMTNFPVSAMRCYVRCVGQITAETTEFSRVVEHVRTAASQIFSAFATKHMSIAAHAL